MDRIAGSVDWHVGTASFSLVFPFEQIPSAFSLWTGDGQVFEFTRNELLALREASGKALDLVVRPRGRADRHGKPWTKEQDQTLRLLWSAKDCPDRIANALGRSKGGVAARLVRLGLIKERWEFDSSLSRLPAR